MAGAVVLRGQRELIAALKTAEKSTGREVRSAFRAVAEPIRQGAEIRARERIPRIGDQWFKMRTGVTQKSVYVAPRQRGVKVRNDPRGRGFGTGPPSFADLLADRAMEPALAANEANIEKATEAALDRVAEAFNRGGPV